MNYPKLHHFLLTALALILLVIIVAAIAEFEGVVAAGLLLIAAALLWIAWELHRLIAFVKTTTEDYLYGFAEGYQQAVTARSSHEEP